MYKENFLTRSIVTEKITEEMVDSPFLETLKMRRNDF